MMLTACADLRFTPDEVGTAADTMADAIEQVLALFVEVSAAVVRSALPSQ